MKIVSFKNCVDHSMESVINHNKIDNTTSKNSIYKIFKHVQLTDDYISKLTLYFVGDGFKSGVDIPWRKFRDALSIFALQKNYISLSNTLRFLHHLIKKKNITFPDASKKLKIPIF